MLLAVTAPVPLRRAAALAEWPGSSPSALLPDVMQTHCGCASGLAQLQNLLQISWDMRQAFKGRKERRNTTVCLSLCLGAFR